MPRHFFGGSGREIANGITIDSKGNVYVAGLTDSTDLPVTASSMPGGGFLLNFNPGAPAVSYATYFDAPVAAIAVDSTGSPYLTGTAGPGFATTAGAYQTALKGFADAFVAKLSSDGMTRIYATLLGGSSSDSGVAIAVDSSGAAWVAGSTSSADFPGSAQAAAASSGAFVARLSADGSGLVFAAVLGNSTASSVMVGGSGNAFVSGTSLAVSAFPTTADALEKRSCSTFESFITEWSPSGAVVYSSLSREGPVLAVDRNEDLYLAGSSGALLATGAALVTRLDLTAGPGPGMLACMTNAASFEFLGAAPGELVTLFGDRLGPDQPAFMQLDGGGRVATALAGVRVLFDGIPAPLLYADANQINAIAPWSLAPGKSSVVAVERSGVRTPSITAAVVQADPGLFRIDSSMLVGQGAILNQDGSLNSRDNPAPRGSIISLFGTGMGLLSPLPLDGEIIGDATHMLALPVEVTFGGPTVGEVLYTGAAPTLPAGVIQINVRVPRNLPDFVLAAGASAIFIKVGDGLLSGALATVAVK